MLSRKAIHFIRTARSNDKFIKNVSVLFLNNHQCNKYVMRHHSRKTNIIQKPLFRSSSLPNGTHTSQYCLPQPIEVAGQKILDYVSENNPESYDEWTEARDYFYTEIPILSDVNYSTVVMNTFLTKNKFISAQYFMKYLQNSNLKPNILTNLQYMALCGKNIEHFGQEEVLETFKKVQKFIDSSPVLDSKRATYLIQGLCGTDRWRLAFDYLPKLVDGLNSEIKESLASAAIKNGDENLAWDIVTNWIKADEQVSNRVIRDFLSFAKKQQSKQMPADKLLLKIFNYIEQKDIIIGKEEADIIEQYFKCHFSKWKVSYSTITRIGECTACKHSLELAYLSDKEFECLKTSFLEKSIKKQDIFINTTDKEFERYINFLEKRKPYQIVVDGLNVAYTVQDAKSGRNLAYHLLQVVKKLSARSRKILVLGREQMIGWPRTIMQRVTQRSDLFLTSNASQDDPFTVYAALSSGPHTYVVTMDLMRDHMSRLNTPKLINLFKKWQRSHQILLTVDKDDIKLMNPIAHSISIQGNMEKAWHIPVEDNIIREPYEELNNWLCIQKII